MIHIKTLYVSYKQEPFLQPGNELFISEFKRVIKNSANDEIGNVLESRI